MESSGALSPPFGSVALSSCVGIGGNVGGIPGPPGGIPGPIVICLGSARSAPNGTAYGAFPPCLLPSMLTVAWPSCCRSAVTGSPLLTSPPRGFSKARSLHNLQQLHPTGSRASGAAAGTPRLLIKARRNNVPMATTENVSCARPSDIFDHHPPSFVPTGEVYTCGVTPSGHKRSREADAAAGDQTHPIADSEEPPLRTGSRHPCRHAARLPRPSPACARSARASRNPPNVLRHPCLSRSRSYPAWSAAN